MKAQLVSSWMGGRQTAASSLVCFKYRYRVLLLTLKVHHYGTVDLISRLVSALHCIDTKSKLTIWQCSLAEPALELWSKQPLSPPAAEDVKLGCKWTLFSPSAEFNDQISFLFLRMYAHTTHSK